MTLERKLQSILIILIIVSLPVYGTISLPSIQTGRAAKPKMRTFIFNPNAADELVIYTHDSFMAWGKPEDYQIVMNQTFYNFGVLHNVTVTVNVFSGMVEALNLLISQKEHPQADLVIGLDNTMVSRAKEEQILLPLLTGVNLENVSADLIAALDPEKYLVPIDYGLIAVIFDTAYINVSTNPELLTMDFDTLLDTFGKTLVVQDPTQSATGLNFLLYQIVLYEKVLGQEWQQWWKKAKGQVTIDKSWSDSWERVFSKKEAHMMVSYGTDPAYNAYFGYSYEHNAAIIHYNGTKYGWLQIEGIGVVNGTTKANLAKEYINYALSSEVQDYVATNNWMFPANNQTTLDPSYDYAITTENVTILNNLIQPNYIGDNYQDWLNTWERLVYGSGTWWIWALISAIALLIAGIVTYFVFKSKTRIDIE
ncbi:MAG: thiamine ABC transporter substrate-binding protein [Candidatus Heimdallarchaeota archaeon]